MLIIRAYYSIIFFTLQPRMWYFKILLICEITHFLSTCFHCDILNKMPKYTHVKGAFYHDVYSLL